MTLRKLFSIAIVLFLSASAQGSSAIGVVYCEWGPGDNRLYLNSGGVDIFEEEGVKLPYEQSNGQILHLNGQAYVPVGVYSRTYLSQEFRMSIDNRAYFGSGHTLSAVFYPVEEAKEHARLANEQAGSEILDYKYKVKSPLVVSISGDYGFISDGKGVTLLPAYSCEWHSSIHN